MLDRCGIYLIVCRPTGQRYVGATRRPFRIRFAQHMTQLRCNRCSIPKLQEAVNTYGLAAMEFVPLRDFPPSELARREKEAIEYLKPELNSAHRGEGHSRKKQRWDPVVYEGEEMSVVEAAARAGMSHQLLRARIARGVAPEYLFVPPQEAPRKPRVQRV